MRRSVALSLACVLLVAACDGPKADPNDPQYKLGYEAGHDDGQNEEKVALCSQIEDYKDSIAEALKEADICPS